MKPVGGRAALLLLAVPWQAAAARASAKARQRAADLAATPLELAGANCSNPGDSIPAYCCEGIIPSARFIDSCECNPGWTHDECMCKGFLAKMPCHECMVHLPATNRWTKTFSKEELYENCEECVSKCKTELEGGQCGSFMADIFASKFPKEEPSAVLCTAGYLKDQLMKEDYPLEVKRALYKPKRLRADDDYHQDSDWKVPGVGSGR